MGKYSHCESEGRQEYVESILEFKLGNLDEGRETWSSSCLKSLSFRRAQRKLREHSHYLKQNKTKLTYCQYTTGTSKTRKHFPTVFVVDARLTALHTNASSSYMSCFCEEELRHFETEEDFQQSFFLFLTV